MNSNKISIENLKLNNDLLISEEKETGVGLPRLNRFSSKASYFLKQKFKQTKNFFKNSNDKLKQTTTISTLASINNSSSSINTINTNQNEQTTCKICLTNFILNNENECQIFELNSCKCKFCINCLFEYVKQSIENCNVLPIHCPDSNCKSNGCLNSDEIKFIILKTNSNLTNANKTIECDTNNNYVANETNLQVEKICFIDNENFQSQDERETSKGVNLYKKYLTVCENLEILRDPLKTHCPKPSCHNVCNIVNTNNNKSENVKVICDRCNLEFCSICLKKWTLNEESENTSLLTNISEICNCKLKFSSEHHHLINQSDFYLNNFENIKRCPKCSILIERADGCAQVMCKVCRHTFCFYCLTSLENDFLLKHYTKNGPCKGKLGHSRISLFFHRFSVIAIFAGTIVLMIILSPFILLSIPCIAMNSKLRKRCFKLSTKFG